MSQVETNSVSANTANPSMKLGQNSEHHDRSSVFPTIEEESKPRNEDSHIPYPLSREDRKNELHGSGKWDWLPCNYELKREAKGYEIYWNLAPSIQLTASEPQVPPKVDIGIALERPFMHSDDLGWNWHKSWNLPSIKANIKIMDPSTKTGILPPSDLKTELLAVKVLSNKAEQFKLFDIGLKGVAVQDLSEGMAVFPGLKFNSTSYNNDGVKFHLVVLIYIMEDQRSGPKILYSRISPPIFVDSRKSARDSNEDRSKKMANKYFDPFYPDAFEKTFIKRNSKQNDGKEELIENSLEGLSQYFTAPNIRNKVKHPIFLAVKFSNCVKLYYNSKNVKIEGKAEFIEEEIVENMQRQFLEDHLRSQMKNDQSLRTKSVEHKPFVLLIEERSNTDSFHLNKKISDYLEPIQNEVIHVFFNSLSLPASFKPLNHEKLAQSYLENYNTLVNMRVILPDKPKKAGEDDTDSNSSFRVSDANIGQVDTIHTIQPKPKVRHPEPDIEPPLVKKQKQEPKPVPSEEPKTSISKPNMDVEVKNEEEEGVRKELNTSQQDTHKEDSVHKAHYPQIPLQGQKSNSSMSTLGFGTRKDSHFEEPWSTTEGGHPSVPHYENHKYLGHIESKSEEIEDNHQNQFMNSRLPASSSNDSLAELLKNQAFLNSAAMRPQSNMSMPMFGAGNGPLGQGTGPNARNPSMNDFAATLSKEMAYLASFGGGEAEKNNQYLNFLLQMQGGNLNQADKANAANLFNPLAANRMNPNNLIQNPAYLNSQMKLSQMPSPRSEMNKLQMLLGMSGMNPLPNTSGIDQRAAANNMNMNNLINQLNNPLYRMMNPNMAMLSKAFEQEAEQKMPFNNYPMNSSNPLYNAKGQKPQSGQNTGTSTNYYNSHHSQGGPGGN